jgi:NAD(P)H-hydrate epimerase
VRELDRIAIEEHGVPGYELMCRAGAAAFTAVRERYPDARHWLVLCGSGNNGGDGYVIARLARAAGIEVRVLALADPAALQGDAAIAWRDYAVAGGAVSHWSGSTGVTEAGFPTDLIIDALLGTGLMRPLEGAYSDAVTAAQALAEAGGLPVVAVDIPSGLSGLSGMPLGIALRACLTVTFVGLKQGLFVGEGPDCTGEIVFADLDIPPVGVDRVRPAMQVFGTDDLRTLLPRRARTANKGDYGHVLLIGGNTGMAGAVRLAGEAALRTGAGLVSVATRLANVAVVVEGRPELMCRGVEDVHDLEPLILRAGVIALGPGLGQDDWARQMFAQALAAGKPLVLDADALNLLAESPAQRSDWILTPHPGEAGRLLGSDARSVQADRLASVAALAERYGGTALLKGHGTLVSAADWPWLIRGGNPGMATAGMGDVLTGIVAAVYAQTLRAGASTDRIAAASAWLHACAGDRAAVKGERGMVAGDLFAELRACLNT